MISLQKKEVVRAHPKLERSESMRRLFGMLGSKEETEAMSVMETLLLYYPLPHSEASVLKTLVLLSASGSQWSDQEIGAQPKYRAESGQRLRRRKRKESIFSKS